MLACVSILALTMSLWFPASGLAVTAAPPISDREIVERLTRLEEGQDALRKQQELLRTEVQQLRQDMKAEIQLLRQDMKTENQLLREDVIAQIGQLRTDINERFATLTQLIVGQLGAFAAIVLFTIGFALWDRKTMTRPLEDKLKGLEEEMAQNRPRFHAFLEALRTASVRDQQIADVLRKFDLL